MATFMRRKLHTVHIHQAEVVDGAKPFETFTIFKIQIHTSINNNNFDYYYLLIIINHFQNTNSTYINK